MHAHALGLLVGYYLKNFHLTTRPFAPKTPQKTEQPQDNKADNKKNHNAQHNNNNYKKHKIITINRLQCREENTQTRKKTPITANASNRKV